MIVLGVVQVVQPLLQLPPTTNLHRRKLFQLRTDH